MVNTPTLPNEARKWYWLGLRHLRMAQSLFRLGMADGAVFHIYHAYECGVSALIAAKGYSVPPSGKTSLTLPSGRTVQGYRSPGTPITEQSTHKARFLLFSQVADQTTQYYQIHARLSRFVRVSDRMDSLYYDAIRDRLPHETYNLAYANSARVEVRNFMKELRRGIP